MKMKLQFNKSKLYNSRVIFQMGQNMKFYQIWLFAWDDLLGNIET